MAASEQLGSILLGKVNAAAKTAKISVSCQILSNFLVTWQPKNSLYPKIIEISKIIVVLALASLGEDNYHYHSILNFFLLTLIWNHSCQLISFEQSWINCFQKCKIWSKVSKLNWWLLKYLGQALHLGYWSSGRENFGSFYCKYPIL